MVITNKKIYILSCLIVFITIIYSQLVLKFVPCEICLLERYPWILLFFTSIIFKNNKTIFYLGTIILIISIGLSIFHTGIEYSFWKSPFSSCQSKNLSVTQMLIESVPPKPCDKPNYIFSFLPISMTFLNGLYSLFILCLTSIIYKRN